MSFQEEPVGSSHALSRMVTYSGADDRRYADRFRAFFLALHFAWNSICKDHTQWQSLPEASEVSLNHLLRDTLDKIRLGGDVAGFTRMTFERPHVSAEFRDSAGRSFRRPDLAVNFAGAEVEPDAGVFVECKLIEEGGANIANYLHHGLMRFVDGSYAAGMRDAVMVGYLKTGQTLREHLAPTLKKRRWRDSLKSDGRLVESAFRRAVYMSEHARRNASGRDLSSIRIHHVWLPI